VCFDHLSDRDRDSLDTKEKMEALTSALTLTLAKVRARVRVRVREG